MPDLFSYFWHLREFDFFRIQSNMSQDKLVKLLFFRLTRLRTLSSTVSQCTPCRVCKAQQLELIFFLGFMTPSLKSVGPGFLTDVSVSLSLSSKDMCICEKRLPFFSAVWKSA